jgi:hypothetical protein
MILQLFARQRKPVAGMRRREVAALAADHSRCHYYTTQLGRDGGIPSPVISFAWI